MDNLTNHDVVSVSEETSEDMAGTYKVSEFWERWAECFMEYNDSDLITEWFKDGKECECLRVGDGSWKKGKIRLSLEFIPDEPESPIDN